MIHRDGNICMLACDSCGTETSTSDDFFALIEEAKGDGWKIRQRSGEWVHHCKDCDGEESAVERAKRKFGLR